jgi:hypothetical protein
VEQTLNIDTQTNTFGILPVQFQLVFAAEHIQFVGGTTSINLETEILQNDTEIFLFWIQKQVFRMRLYITDVITTGDVRYRLCWQRGLVFDSTV